MASTAHLLEEAATPLPVLDLPIREEPTVANRRSLPRICSRFEVRLRGDGTVFSGVDLSFGGLMCASGEPIWPGNVVDFDLVLPGEPRPLMLQGRVAELVEHHGTVAMRLRFEGIDQTSRKRIAGWMARTRGV